jgi:1,4-dihydroxy-2-naphthoate octaprenyltransferase
LTNTLGQYLKATRPSFLSITLIAYLIGYSINPTIGYSTVGALGLIVALLAHAAGNVINDFHDSVNGSDVANIERIYPFTGGSRMIQDGVFTNQQIRRVAIVLFSLSILIGISVTYFSSISLIFVGMLGLFLAWAYSAPPFKLMSRGLIGELSITLSWTLVVIGAAILSESTQASHIGLLTYIAIGLSYGFSVTNILFVNQIPDITADLSAKKHTLAATIQEKHLWLYYLCFNLLAYSTLLAGHLFGMVNGIHLIALLIIPLHLYITYLLINSLHQKGTIKRAIILTIIGTHIYGAILVISNVLSN